jgi:hypothetical protein
MRLLFARVILAGHFDKCLTGMAMRRLGSLRQETREGNAPVIPPTPRSYLDTTMDQAFRTKYGNTFQRIATHFQFSIQLEKAGRGQGLGDR